MLFLICGIPWYEPEVNRSARGGSQRNSVTQICIKWIHVNHSHPRSLHHKLLRLVPDIQRKAFLFEELRVHTRRQDLREQTVSDRHRFSSVCSCHCDHKWAWKQVRQVNKHTGWNKKHRPDKQMRWEPSVPCGDHLSWHQSPSWRVSLLPVKNTEWVRQELRLVLFFNLDSLVSSFVLSSHHQAFPLLFHLK